MSEAWAAAHANYLATLLDGGPNPRLRASAESAVAPATICSSAACHSGTVLHSFCRPSTV